MVFTNEYATQKNLTSWHDPSGFSFQEHSTTLPHAAMSARRSSGVRLTEDNSSPTCNPLRDVVASTFLGNPEYIDRVRKGAVESKSQDMRDVPALRELTERPSLEHIEETVKSIIGTDHPLYRKLCIYLAHQHTGLSLTEIGNYFGMRGPAVSQASRRFRQDITDDRNLKKLLLRIMKGLGFGEG